MEPYSSIKAIEESFEKSLLKASAKIGITPDNIYSNAESIDMNVANCEVAAMWIRGQEYVNGFKRLKALSLFPAITSDDIKAYIHSSRLFLSNYDNKKPETVPEKIFNDLLRAYTNGMELSLGHGTTEIRKEYAK